MRLITRTLVFVIVILAAFWFTAENARQIVSVDLAFLRVRASLPLVVFGSVLAGMGLSFLVGWRAERRVRAGASSRPQLLRESDPFDAVRGDLESATRAQAADDREAEGSSRDEPEPLEWR